MLDLQANDLGFIQNRMLAAYQKLVATGYQEDNIQSHFLRAEVFLENGKSDYEMELGKSAGKIAGPREKLLQTNDAYAPIALSLGVSKVPISNNAESVSGKSIVYPYVDDGVFNGAALAGNTEAECVESVFNGDFSMKTDSTEIIYGVDTSRLKYVPQNRFTATRIQCSTGSLASYEGYYPFIKQFAIFGGNQNIVRLNLKGAATNQIAAADGQTATQRNKVVVIFAGLIIRGGSDNVKHIDIRKAKEKGVLYL
jgi:hypothetical protein